MFSRCESFFSVVCSFFVLSGGSFCVPFCYNFHSLKELCEKKKRTAKCGHYLQCRVNCMDFITTIKRKEEVSWKGRKVEASH